MSLESMDEFEVMVDRLSVDKSTRAIVFTEWEVLRD
jgi:hypothetical protein